MGNLLINFIFNMNEGRAVMNGRINLHEGHAGGRLETLLFRAQGLGAVFPASPGPALALQQGIPMAEAPQQSRGGQFFQGRSGGVGLEIGLPQSLYPPAKGSGLLPLLLVVFGTTCVILLQAHSWGVLMLGPAPVHDCTRQV